MAGLGLGQRLSFKMRWEELENLSKKELVSLMRICRRDMRFFDGLWFINIEDEFGFEKALDIHCNMWRRFGEYQAKLIARSFDLGQKPIPALVTAIEIDPAWLSWGYQVELVSNTKAIFRVTECTAQQARLRSGRDINPYCQRVDFLYFKTFAQVIDPRINVKCNFGPPNNYSNDLWCEWCFYLAE
jgi:hypothetical protein